MEKIEKASRFCLIVPIVVFIVLVVLAVFNFAVPNEVRRLILFASFFMAYIIEARVIHKNLEKASPTAYKELEEISSNVFTSGFRIFKYGLSKNPEDTEDVKAVKKCILRVLWSTLLMLSLVIVDTIFLY